jgi:hypothetical protein
MKLGNISSRIARWWRNFRFDPYWRAFVEVGVTVFFTFFPILLISMPILLGGEDLSQSTIWDNFASYWRSGELTLPILGLCGTLVAITSLNNHSISGMFRVVSFLLATTVAVLCGYVLGTNRGFDKPIYPEVVGLMFLIYFVIILVWLFIAMAVNRGPIERTDAESRADKLVLAKQRVKGRVK